MWLKNPLRILIRISFRSHWLDFIVTRFLADAEIELLCVKEKDWACSKIRNMYYYSDFLWLCTGPPTLNCSPRTGSPGLATPNYLLLTEPIILTWIWTRRTGDPFNLYFIFCELSHLLYCSSFSYPTVY